MPFITIGTGGDLRTYQMEHRFRQLVRRATHQRMGGSRRLRPGPPLEKLGLMLVAPCGRHRATKVGTVRRCVEPGWHATNHGRTSPDLREYRTRCR
ncbi:hypothetical protein CEXT_502001 [Caerostris extrusa]|uniref:Uncharacterized protein n=1 Tax=Caerostris extrusa TaxID=172846 RepID=A0AAV4MSW1_CAEEX|nr:hypothetical protein CEXT_502001 [Caerostris extrusa]